MKPATKLKKFRNNLKSGQWVAFNFDLNHFYGVRFGRYEFKGDTVVSIISTEDVGYSIYDIYPIDELLADAQRLKKKNIDAGFEAGND